MVLTYICHLSTTNVSCKICSRISLVSSFSCFLLWFCRMLSKVKLEIDTFDITVEDIDLLDQVVVHFEKLLEVNFFKVSAICFVLPINDQGSCTYCCTFD